MPLPFPFDFKNPDYVEVFEYRMEKLERIKKNPAIIPSLREYYRQNPAQNIIDWGTTYDPRNLKRGLPATIPFILFPKQEDCIFELEQCYNNDEPLLIEKSRDVGMSELLVSYAVTKCVYNFEFIFGFGSRIEDLVDAKNPNALLYKARKFLMHMPVELRGEWNERRDSKHKLITIPLMNSKIIGECGDNMGRGGRYSAYADDESAWHPHQELVDAALLGATNFRITLSTPHGLNNLFARKIMSGKNRKFTYPWYADPRKDQAWYEKKKSETECPVRFAQEYDLDYYGSIECVIIPAIWIRSCIDAHIKLGITITGRKKAGLDIADTGPDKNAYASLHGVLLRRVTQWSGSSIDIHKTVEIAIGYCNKYGDEELIYDASGMGADARGAGRVINDNLEKDNERTVPVIPFFGQGAVIDPEGNPFFHPWESREEVKEGQMNKNFYWNRKSQGWASLRRRIHLTHRAVTEGIEFDPDKILCISSDIEDIEGLIGEISQVQYEEDASGKIKVQKKPKGGKSPNRADAVMMVCAPAKEKRGFPSGVRISKRRL